MAAFLIVCRTAVCAFCVSSLIAVDAAEARGLGRFLSGLLSRGVARTGFRVFIPKSYSPDVLTVNQLAQCLKKANALDQESQDIQVRRLGLTARDTEIDSLGTQIELKRAALNSYSQAAV